MHSLAVRRAEAILLAALLLVAGAASSGVASAGTLDQIKQDQTIRLAYREDAPPFSYLQGGEPAGFMLDLCRAVTTKLADQLQVPPLKIAYVPVTAANRFEAITGGKADLLCEATSATLSRRELVDFSIATFIDGASVMVRADRANDVAALAGQKIGVLAGTTTEAAARKFLEEANVTAEIIPMKIHAEGLAMLDDGKISAYFGDRSVLLFLAQGSKSRESLRLAKEYLTTEPYALALPRGDEEFRLAVDRALSHIYRSGDIETIFTRGFGGTVRPTDILLAVYLISALPD
jgi:ABC-type amino acid transport substrate-binding protein